MIPKSGRVLERNPITMECNKHCISTLTSRYRNKGSVHGISVPCGKGRSVKSKYKQEL